MRPSPHALVAVAGVGGNQFQVLQQRAGVGDEFDVSAARADKDGLPGAGRDAGAHELIAAQLLFAAQAADGFLVGVGRDAVGSLDGWFHIVDSLNVIP